MPISSETKLAAVEANTRPTPSFLEALRSSVKALVPKTRRVIPFSVLGRNNYPSLGGDFGGFYGGGSPGSTYDYRAAAGELLENSVVAACVDTVGQALSDAPPILEKLVGTEWERVAGHAVIDLLSFPNKYHNPFEIWSAVAGAEMTTGEAFWRLEWNAARTRPTEIWYERPDSMRVIGTDEEYIAKYVFRRDDGAQFELNNSDVVHFRYALNPWNARRGSAPIRAGLRQIAGDNSAATFHGALLRNCAVMSLLVSVKDGQNDNTTPDQLDEFTRLLSQKLRGDNAGAIAGVNLPLDVHKMGYSPDEMALDKLISYYEARICALLRVDPMVVSLGSGTMQKTYANMGEALNDFWERRILPTKKRHSAVLGAQLLPLFGLDPSVYRISWDYRNVAPLQENEDARHARYREDYRARVIDLYDAQIGLGMNPSQAMRGVFYGDSGGGESAKSLKVYDRNGTWHGEHNGRFESRDGAGGGAFDSSHHTWTGDEVAPDSDKVQRGKALAMKVLYTFTNPAMRQEASVAVGIPDGNVHKFLFGEPFAVDVHLPEEGDFATFHTHSRNTTFSERDYFDFFQNTREVQMHVITPDYTFSLYKPAGFVTPDYSEDQIKQQMKKQGIRATGESLALGFYDNLTGIDMTKLAYLAEMYGLKYRIGFRTTVENKD